MKKTLLISAVLIFFSLAPVVTLAADGCISVGPPCTINGSAGACALNSDNGDFYCRPNALDQPVQTSANSSGFVPLAPIPGLTKDVPNSAAGLATFFNNLYKFAIGIAAVLAVIMIIWGGIEIATNKDNVSKIIDSKGRILQAVLGLVLVLSPVLVFSIINPSILNLSINLPELDTRSGPPATVTPTGTPTAGTITSYSEVQPGFWCYTSRRNAGTGGTVGPRCFGLENDCRIVAVRELGSAGETICSLTPR